MMTSASMPRVWDPGVVAHSARANAHSLPCCQLCGQKGVQVYSGMVDWLFGVPGSWGMLRCSRCQILWLDPQPAAGDIASLYVRYITHNDRPPATWFGRLQHAVSQHALWRLGYPVENPREFLPRLLAQFPAAKRDAKLSIAGLPPVRSGTLLDVGCGNGDFILRMSSMGWRVFGVDPDPAAAALGRARGLEIFTGTISDVPESSQFDAIVLNHVIEHVADPVEFLKDCSRRLRPTVGRLVITTPNISSLGHQQFCKYWRGLEVPRHFHVFSQHGLRQCVEQAGLRIASMSTETRLATMIYYQSSLAKQGRALIGELKDFKTRKKVNAHLFRLLESLLVYCGKDAGEELFCTCTRPNETNTATNSGYVTSQEEHLSS